MYFDDFSNRLRKNSLPSLLLFYGDSEGVIFEGLQAVKKAFLSANPTGAIENFDAVESGLPKVLSAAQTSFLFASLQLLVVNNAEKILGGRSEEAVKQLSSYCENLNTTTHLVFLAEGMRKTAKVVSLIEKNGWAVQCSDIPEWKISSWLQEQCKAKGITLSDEAAKDLLLKIGPNISFLQRALEHLSIYLYPGKNASAKDIRDLPAPGIESEIFSLFDAAGTRRIENALNLFQQIGSGAESGVLTMLYGRMRDLLQISIGRSEGLDPSALTSKLGIHPFRLKNLWSQSERYSTEELKRFMKKLIYLQFGVVTGRLGKEVVGPAIENWILSLNRKNALGSSVSKGSKT